MAVSVNLTDKIIAGLHHSFTITSDEGPPAGEVRVGGEVIPHRLIPLREPKWKVSFLLPADSAGKELELRFRAGTSTLEETAEIVAG